MCRALHLLEDGRLRLVRTTSGGRPLVVNLPTPGQLFGAAALFGPCRYPVSAEALTTSTVVSVPREVLLEEMRHHPELYERMLDIFASCVHMLLERIQELSQGGAASRLAHYLMRLPAKDNGAMLTIELPMPKREIASQLNIAPETLSRIFRDWQDRGIVEMKSRLVSIRDLERLESVAQEE